MADRAKFLSFLDMIDGGGAGDRGDKFEGGGIFSMLANAIATPYGSEDEGRRQARMQAYGLLGDKAPAPSASIMSTPVPAVQPVMRPKPRPDNLNVPAQTPLSAFGGAGPNVAGAAAERGMGLSPFGGAGPAVSDPRGFAPNTQPTFAAQTPSAPAQPAQAATPSMEQYQAVAKQLAQEMGNAFFMMPREEQILRIQQRMRGM